MSFTGTLDKCKVCDKTVYFVDMMSLEGVPYHKTCFRCSHCNGPLVMSNYSSMDGVLYCKTHFEQLFKESGNFSKNFSKIIAPFSMLWPHRFYLYNTNTATSKYLFHDLLARTPSKLSSMFSGTIDKCAACEKTVYPLEKVTMEGECYHKTCFRCAHGGCPLTHSSYASLDGVLYCKHHFARLFMEKGDYKHVLDSATHRRTNSCSSSTTPPPEPAEPNPEPPSEEQAAEAEE
ncbi:hypothetical protein SAY87_029537 [Trapa incisa]|uniref:LIM zinc-binding domain-containing protein n=1 Tax=Trapa incisa TaxID=236973 RepID=A0AAN7K4N0_9MYRT|nr:hypothetical protein SAY87_029537 [Trapa incisa]